MSKKSPRRAVGISVMKMRFGLWGQVRRRWGLRGVKIIQPKQIQYTWRYLVVAVDVIHLDLKWTWADRMNQDNLIPIFKQWNLETVIWDGASSHRGQDMGQCLTAPRFSSIKH